MNAFLTSLSKKAKLIVLGTTAGALLLLLGAVIFLRKEVTLVINGDSQQQITYSLTVRNFLENQGIQLLPEDDLSPPASAWMKGGTVVRLDRASQVLIHADNQYFSVFTSSRTPSGILEDAGVPFNAGDRVYIDGQMLPPDGQIPYGPAHSLELRRASRISLRADGKSVTILSSAPILGKALWDEGFELKGGDFLNPSPMTLLAGDPLQVQYTSARELTITLPGRSFRTRSAAESVGSALAQAGFSLQGLDYSLPADDQPLPANGIIQIVRVLEELLLEQVPIPFGNSFQSAPEAEIDSRVILEPGEYGVEARRVRVRYENGEEVSREVEKEWVVKEPRDRVVGYGTKVLQGTVDTNQGPRQYWRKINAYATSYKPGDPGVGNITASGTRLRKGVVAVKVSWFSYMKGLEVYIPGYGFGRIEDAGGGIPGRTWIDLGYEKDNYVPWSQNVTVYFLYPVPPADSIMWVLD